VSGVPAVLVDRDGTLNEDRGYIGRVELFELFPYSVEALWVLQRAGFRIVVVTNQAGVARGMFDEAFVRTSHEWFRRRFAAGGVHLDGLYHCPHHPHGVVPEYTKACDCRKPNPGMALRAARDLDLDLSRSFVIGDTWLDVGLANNVGARGILVRTGYGATEEPRPPDGAHAAAVVDHVHAAATWILRQPREGRA
jgi:D-glycero-D-manno-heptose 1,7-bisphosphate phosphatase